MVVGSHIHHQNRVCDPSVLHRSSKSVQLVALGHCCPTQIDQTDSDRRLLPQKSRTHLGERLERHPQQSVSLTKIIVVLSCVVIVAQICLLD
jgi:hypothetical protein